ncbi:hypothetical protein [Cryptosporangium minutisporangium]|uniref:XRE family transcriptional regulator n=1 Tax=Cryptosporangium minutisporangium TaxID=113569 RepID=A0ABP6SR93_9ACTN
MPKPARTLARRLRQLRFDGTDAALTPAEMASLLRSTAATVTAYEDQLHPVVPSAEHLVEYSRLFRAAESASQAFLLEELLRLRAAAIGLPPVVRTDPWFFGDSAPIVVLSLGGSLGSVETGPLLAALSRVHAANPGRRVSLHVVAAPDALDPRHLSRHLVLVPAAARLATATTDWLRNFGLDVPWPEREGSVPSRVDSPFHPRRSVLLCPA